MYKLSKAAANDIEEILTRSTLDFGVARTEIYYQSLTQCLELLGNNPEMGSAVDDIRRGYRCFLHESHVIFYKQREKDILIIRILHKRMDANQNLQD